MSRARVNWSIRSLRPLLIISRYRFRVVAQGTIKDWPTEKGSGRWSVVSGRRTVVSDQWSVVSKTCQPAATKHFW